MHLKQKLSQHRRDFRAIYECAHCGDTVEGTGYDDANFHENVIPTMVCKSCGKIGGGVSTRADVPAWAHL